MSAVKYLIIDILKTNKIFQPLYFLLKRRVNIPEFKIQDIKNILPIESNNEDVRLNLILPTLRRTKVFGGITTTIKILKILMKEMKVKGRIIVLNNEKYSRKWTYYVKDFEPENDKGNSIVYAKDNVDIAKNDILIFSSWMTAYSFIPILMWQKRKYQLKNRTAIYIIQDYEPGFSPWSSKYALTDSTYCEYPEHIYALFNSSQLYSFFKKRGYSFACEEYFEPTLHEELRKVLLKNEYVKKEKKIIVYGRPSEHRNAFEIIKGALKIWSEIYPKSNDWELISLGEGFSDIKFNDIVLKVKGKVSIEEYAKIMLSSYAGISLMISPHPSYPPLEMSTFGVKTITNSFDNKDLSSFNENIYSVDICKPEIIAEKLKSLCENYNDNEVKLSVNSNYTNNLLFEDTIRKFSKIIKQMYEADICFDNI